MIWFETRAQFLIPDAGLTAALRLMEVQQGLRESAHFSPKEGSNLNVTTFNTQ